MKSTVHILVRRGPYGLIHTAEALRHVNGALAEGLKPMVIFVDDGVYSIRRVNTAINSPWTELSSQWEKLLMPSQKSLTPEFYLHQPSLKARGLRPEELINGIALVDDAGLASLLSHCETLMLF